MANAQPLHIPKRTSEGSFRAFGMFGVYGTSEQPARIWIATPIENPKDPVFADTVLKIKDASGNIDQVFAGEPGLQFG